jgi:hypothetical protein
VVVVESCLIIVSPLVDAAAILLLQVLVDDVLLPRDFGAFPPEVAPFVGVTLLVGVPRRQSTELTPERKFPSTRQTLPAFLRQRALAGPLGRSTSTPTGWTSWSTMPEWPSTAG